MKGNKKLSQLDKDLNITGWLTPFASLHDVLQEWK